MENIILEAQLDYLGDYFVHNNIYETYNVTFEDFVEMNRVGTWEQYRKSKEQGPVVTQLSPVEVSSLLTLGTDEEVTYLAQRWMGLYNEIAERTQKNQNIISPATTLLTVDSQLKYLLEEEN